MSVASVLNGLPLTPLYLSKEDRMYLGKDKVVTLELAGLLHPMIAKYSYRKDFLDKVWKAYLAGEI